MVNEGFGRHFWNVPLIITLSDAFLKVRYLRRREYPTLTLLP